MDCLFVPLPFNNNRTQLYLLTLEMIFQTNYLDVDCQYLKYWDMKFVV